MSSDSKQFIVLVAGEGGVGKSTLIKYLLEGVYIPQRLTVGLNVETYTLTIDGPEYHLTIRDAGGEERFRFMMPMWTRGAKGALLVFDLGRYHTFLHLPDWLELMRDSLAPSRILLVGAKCDIGDDREVDTSEAHDIVGRYGLAGYVETSSMMGIGVRDAFEMLVRRIAASEGPPS